MRRSPRMYGQSTSGTSTDPSPDAAGDDLPDEPEVLPEIPDAPPAPEGEAEPK